MANQKLTALTENTTPLSTDITYIVDDPAWTADSQKVTFSNAITKAHWLSDWVVKVASWTMAPAVAWTDYVTPTWTESLTNKTVNGVVLSTWEGSSTFLNWAWNYVAWTTDINWLTAENGALDGNDEIIFYDNTAWANRKRSAQASETVEWLVERATDAEAATWTDTTRYISPKQAKDNYWMVTDVVVLTRAQTAASWSVNYSHSLWKEPKVIIFNAFWDWGGSSNAVSHWSYDGSGNAVSFSYSWAVTWPWNSTTKCIRIWNSSSEYQEWDVSAVSTTDFTINWTRVWTWTAPDAYVTATLIS